MNGTMYLQTHVRSLLKVTDVIMTHRKARHTVATPPRSEELDSRGRAEYIDSGSLVAFGDARVLSSDEGSGEGENGESEEAEHDVGV